MAALLMLLLPTGVPTLPLLSSYQLSHQVKCITVANNSPVMFVARQGTGCGLGAEQASMSVRGSTTVALPMANIDPRLQHSELD